MCWVQPELSFQRCWLYFCTFLYFNSTFGNALNPIVFVFTCSFIWNALVHQVTCKHLYNRHLSPAAHYAEHIQYALYVLAQPSISWAIQHVKMPYVLAQYHHHHHQQLLPLLETVYINHYIKRISSNEFQLKTVADIARQENTQLNTHASISLVPIVEKKNVQLLVFEK